MKVVTFILLNRSQLNVIWLVSVQCLTTGDYGQLQGNNDDVALDNDDIQLNSDGGSGTDDPSDSVAYCQPYCDVTGYQQPGQFCLHNDQEDEEYCCGDATHRYCCPEKDKAISPEHAKANYDCPYSNWWTNQ